MLLVHSKSTEQYLDEWGYGERLLVTQPPVVGTFISESYDEVIAIGGGAVIDTAKIISRNPVIAIPTTFSGASRTSHAVYWCNGRKCNISTKKPVTLLKPNYLETLPTKMLLCSRVDCICHALESLLSKQSTQRSRFYAATALTIVCKKSLTEWLNASLLAGEAIEITGTNILHALSYSLTAIYGIPHAEGLAFLLRRIFPLLNPLICPVPIDFDLIPDTSLSMDATEVIEEAYTYPKMFDSNMGITKDELKEVLT